MTFTMKVFFAVLVGALLAAGVPFLLSGAWVGCVAALAAGMILGSAPYLRWNGLANLGLLGFVLVAVIGVWIGQPPVWHVAAITLAITAWNLAYFTRRLRYFKKQVVFKLESRHLGQLTLVGLAGFGAGVTALTIQVNLAFGGAVLLVITAGIGLAVGVRALIRENERYASRNTDSESRAR